MDVKFSCGKRIFTLIVQRTLHGEYTDFYKIEYAVL